MKPSIKRRNPVVVHGGDLLKKGHRHESPKDYNRQKQKNIIRNFKKYGESY